MLLAEQHSAPFKERPDFSEDGAMKRPLPKKRSQNRKFIKILVCVFCLIIANLIFQSLVIKQTREIKAWQTKLAKLERRSVQLRMEMADLESFRRIQTAAERELGMRVAGPNDYLCIAAAPELRKNQPESYETYTAKPAPPSNLWNKLAGWLEGIGETMAQTP